MGCVMPLTGSKPSAVAQEDMPPVTPELVLIRTMAIALIKTLGRKKGTVFLREWAAALQAEDTILPIRPPSEPGQGLAARRQALAYFWAVLSALIASLPAEK